MLSGVTVNATPVSDINRLSDNIQIVGAGIVFASILAVYGLVNTRFNNFQSVSFLIPQQTLMFISAFSSMGAVFAEHYADGVARTSSFIFAGELPTIVGVVWHSIAIIDLLAKKSHD